MHHPPSQSIRLMLVLWLLGASLLSLPGNPVLAGGRDCGGTSLLAQTAGAPSGPPASSEPRVAPAAITQQSYTWNNDGEFISGNFTQSTLSRGSVSLDSPWTPDQQVDDEVGTALQTQPSAAASGNLVYAAWQDTRNGNPDIYVSRVDDPSAQLDRKINSDIGSATQAYPSLVASADGKALFLAWQDERNGDADIYLAVGSVTASGVTWGRNIKVAAASGPGDQTRPSLALVSATAGAQGYQLCMCWQNKALGASQSDIFAAGSFTSGSSWGIPAMVHPPSSANQTNPSLVAFASGYAVAWQDDRNDTGDIYLTRRIGVGGDWLGETLLSTAPASTAQTQPRLAVGPTSELYVVWRDTSSTSAIALARSPDAGQTWPTPIRKLATSAHATAAPNVVVNASGTVFVSWQAPGGSQSNLAFARSTTGGSSWFYGARANTAAGSVATATPPAMAINASKQLYLAWPDNRNGSGALYGARWPRDTFYVSSGDYLSAVFDTKGIADWQSLVWEATAGSGTASMAVRAGNSPSPDASWTDWLPLASTPASLTGLAHGRYFQWRTALSTTSVRNTPQLESVTVTWQPVALVPKGYLATIYR